MWVWKTDWQHGVSQQDSSLVTLFLVCLWHKHSCIFSRWHQNLVSLPTLTPCHSFQMLCMTLEGCEPDFHGCAHCERHETFHCKLGFERNTTAPLGQIKLVCSLKAYVSLTSISCGEWIRSCCHGFYFCWWLAESQSWMNKDLNQTNAVHVVFIIIIIIII